MCEKNNIKQMVEIRADGHLEYNTATVDVFFNTFKNL